MKLVILHRQEGKTNELIKWLEGGEEQETYPFHSRVIITTTIQEADRIRHILRGKHQDSYQWIFSYDEWCKAYVPYSHLVEVAIDNADEFLQNLFRGNGIIKVASFNKDGD